jgi:hypothetical protein
MDAVKLSGAEQNILKVLKQMEVETRIRADQRARDIGEFKTYVLKIACAQQGITDGQFELSPDGTELVPVEPKKGETP